MEKKKGGSWVGILRAGIWIVILLAGAVGTSLLRAGSSSKAIAEGTNEALTGWGVAVMIVSLLLLVWNFVWGMKRWAEKWHEGKWKVFGGIMRTVWGGVWRGVVFGVIIIFSLIVVAPKITDGVRMAVLAKEEDEWLAGQVRIEEDFRQGNILPDEYLRYTLAVAYGTEEVPKEYRTDQAEMAPDILGIIEEYGEEMSRETLEMALDVVILANVEVGLDASGNVAKNNESLMDRVLGVKKASAYTKKVTTLNKAVLSDEGNFVVFYTDRGDDAISDEKAEGLAEMMERIIGGYREKLGLEYAYNYIPTDKGNERELKLVLNNSGLDMNILESAMAVYVANPYKNDSNVLAFYSGEHLAETLNRILMKIASWFPAGEDAWDMAKITASTPGVPFIVILPDNVDDESLELVTAHEIGHHYQNNYCQAESGKQCISGEFVSETGANWMALNVVEEWPEGNVIEGHHNTYVNYGTCYKVSEAVPEPPKEDACHGSGSFTGYPPVAFLQNYYEVVDGATEKLVGALMAEDALKYLREQATVEEFREVMGRLARNNLMNDYEKISLNALETPKGSDLDCEGKMMCSAEFALRPTAIKYIYLATEEYDRVKVTVTGTAEDVISVLGKNAQDKWEVIAEGMGKMEYTAEKTGEYEVVAFAVANASVTEEGTFKVEAVVEEVAEIVEEEATSGSILGETIDGCTVVDFQGLMDNFLAIGKSTFELLDMMGVETGDTGEFEQGISEAKQSMLGKRLMVCELKMKRGVSMDQVEQVARGTMWVGYRVLTMRDSGIETRVIAGVDQAKRQGKIYLLGEEEGKVYMLEIRVEEE